MVILVDQYAAVNPWTRRRAATELTTVSVGMVEVGLLPSVRSATRPLSASTTLFSVPAPLLRWPCPTDGCCRRAATERHL